MGILIHLCLLAPVLYLSAQLYLSVSWPSQVSKLDTPTSCVAMLGAKFETPAIDFYGFLVAIVAAYALLVLGLDSK
jgi:hypothetical protein